MQFKLTWKLVIFIIVLIVLSTSITAYAVSTYYASITGNVTITQGSTGAISASPSSFSATVTVGGSTSTIITLSNTGTVPITISGITTTESDYGSWLSFSINDTGGVIQPSQSTPCLLSISASSSSPVEVQSSITITFSATS